MENSDESEFMDLSDSYQNEIENERNENENELNITETRMDKEPFRNLGQVGNLRSLEEIPEKYRSVFNYPFFNIIQSHMIDDVLYNDKSLVVSSPTGSGKTVLFELAIVRILIEMEKANEENFKMVYVAPIKALCTERLNEWHMKFSPLNISCIILTGDSTRIDLQLITNYQLILTTPEKWDIITRNINNNNNNNNHIIDDVKLFMIDEVHLLNEEHRGPILEAIVSRMKIMQRNTKIRFIAVSATIPNIEDIADWLGEDGNPAVFYKVGENLRPVKLKKIVLGYPDQIGFKFDLSLNYKLGSVIMQYSDGKPTLIFCSTRKGVDLASTRISQEITFHLSPEQKSTLQQAADTMIDPKSRLKLINGVGSHHAGMTMENRNTIEDLFRRGVLPVLVSTSTLAMGINLPAHLVIIKSTQHYVDGQFQSYTDGHLLQMIGRAGRPQFDQNATVVIMTRASQKQHYEKLMDGSELIESNLHRHLTEHLNAEISMGIITDIAVAFNWVRSTYLYMRALKKPKHYNIPNNLPKEKIEQKLQDLCQIEINGLNRYGMLKIDQDDGFTVTPTSLGKLMTKYYLTLDTMKIFLQVKADENLSDMLMLISKCSEFSGTCLRMNDKRTLNTLNRCKTQNTIRFALPGTIKNVSMKVNCIIQAVFGCLRINDVGLYQESTKIMNIGERISKSLSEYLQSKEKCYQALKNALTLRQCFNAKLWENSVYVSKQLPGIGPALSNALVNAGKTTFKSLLEANPRDIERIINRAPPMGNELQEAIAKLPQYCLEVKCVDNNQLQIEVKVTLLNADQILRHNTVDNYSHMTLLIGDSANNILFCNKLRHSYMALNKEYRKVVNIVLHTDHDVFTDLISENWVGIDCLQNVQITISNNRMIQLDLKNGNKNKTSKENQIRNVKNQKDITYFFKTKKNCPTSTITKSAVQTKNRNVITNNMWNGNKKANNVENLNSLSALNFHSEIKKLKNQYSSTNSMENLSENDFSNNQQFDINEENFSEYQNKMNTEINSRTDTMKLQTPHSEEKNRGQCGNSTFSKNKTNVKKNSLLKFLVPSMKPKQNFNTSSNNYQQKQQINLREENVNKTNANNEYSENINQSSQTVLVEDGRNSKMSNLMLKSLERRNLFLQRNQEIRNKEIMNNENNSMNKTDSKFIKTPNQQQQINLRKEHFNKSNATNFDPSTIDSNNNNNNNNNSEVNYTLKNASVLSMNNERNSKTSDATLKPFQGRSLIEKNHEIVNNENNCKPKFNSIPNHQHQQINLGVENFNKPNVNNKSEMNCISKNATVLSMNNERNSKTSDLTLKPHERRNLIQRNQEIVNNENNSMEMKDSIMKYCKSNFNFIPNYQQQQINLGKDFSKNVINNKLETNYTSSSSSLSIIQNERNLKRNQEIMNIENNSMNKNCKYHGSMENESILSTPHQRSTFSSILNVNMNQPVSRDLSLKISRFDALHKRPRNLKPKKNLYTPRQMVKEQLNVKNPAEFLSQFKRTPQSSQCSQKFDYSRNNTSLQYRNNGNISSQLLTWSQIGSNIHQHQRYQQHQQQYQHHQQFDEPNLNEYSAQSVNYRTIEEVKEVDIVQQFEDESHVKLPFEQKTEILFENSTIRSIKKSYFPTTIEEYVKKRVEKIEPEQSQCDDENSFNFNIGIADCILSLVNDAEKNNKVEEMKEFRQQFRTEPSAILNYWSNKDEVNPELESNSQSNLDVSLLLNNEFEENHNYFPMEDENENENVNYDLQEENDCDKENELQLSFLTNSPEADHSNRISNDSFDDCNADNLNNSFDLFTSAKTTIRPSQYKETTRMYEDNGCKYSLTIVEKNEDQCPTFNNYNSTVNENLFNSSFRPYSQSTRTQFSFVTNESDNFFKF